MRILFIDIYKSFYDKHWVYALTSALRQKGINDLYFLPINLKSASSIKKIIAIKPDLILYNVISSEISQVLEFDARVKSALSCRSIVGGPGPTFSNIDIQKTSLDAICIGEGETALKDYIESGMKSGRNLVTRDKENWEKAPEINMAHMPMPDRSVVYEADNLIARIPSKAFMSGRGCPYRCTYCFNHAYHKMFGNHVRKRPVGLLLDEIEFVRARYPLKIVAFQDDTFCIDRSWLEEFAQEYPRKVALPFACNVRANLIDEQVVRMLKEAGVRAVSWSVETADDDLRNNVLKRNITREQMSLTATLLKKYRIPYRIANIIGIPGETDAQVCETIDYNVKLGSVLTTANIFVPYPRLELTDYAVEKGYLKKQKSELPRNFFVRSSLEIDKKREAYLIKSYCLIPFFVWYPMLWNKSLLRKLLYGLPRIFLRCVYELTYLVAAKSVYKIKTPLDCSLRMAWRYLKGL
jgi:anaerobic magnesium-protoporphyrin IX monomethyl ester cyclase